MIIEWSNLKDYKTLLGKPLTLTIGVFDGLHIGHRKLIQTMHNNSKGLEPVIITFKQNPIQVMSKDNFPGCILSLKQKLNKLGRLSIHKVILIDFSLKFSKLRGREFLRKLVGILNIKQIVAGYNFHFGREKEIDINILKKLLKADGIELKKVEPAYYKNKIVSSTLIRDAIIQGKLDDAKNMLNCEYELDLEGQKPVRIKDSCYIKRNCLCQILPGTGSYECIFKTVEKDFAGILNIELSNINWKQNHDNEIKAICFQTIRKGD